MKSLCFLCNTHHTQVSNKARSVHISIAVRNFFKGDSFSGGSNTKLTSPPRIVNTVDIEESKGFRIEIVARTATPPQLNKMKRNNLASHFLLSFFCHSISFLSYDKIFLLLQAPSYVSIIEWQFYGPLAFSL